MGVVAGGVAVEVDAHDEFERLERLAEPLLTADREERVAGDDDQRLHRLLGVEDVLGEQVAGERPAAHRPNSDVDEPGVVLPAPALALA